MKTLLLCGMLVLSGCADAKSSVSSGRSSSHKSSSYKSSISTRASVRQRNATPALSVRPTTSRCSGTQAPFVGYDWDDLEYEMACPTGRKMNRFGRCECK